ncbi:MAG: hypothetical protein ABIQ93_00450 [Saprospiraceae bacterium]
MSTLFLLPFVLSGRTNATWYFHLQPFLFRIYDFSPSIMSMKGWRNRSAIQYYAKRKSNNIALFLAGIIVFISLFTFIQWALYRMNGFFFYACFLLACPAFIV